MMAYKYANIKTYLHGIAFNGRLAYAMGAHMGATGEFTDILTVRR
jgi:hypothetical protein